MNENAASRAIAIRQPTRLGTASVVSVERIARIAPPASGEGDNAPSPVPARFAASSNASSTVSCAAASAERAARSPCAARIVAPARAPRPAATRAAVAVR